VVQLPGGLQHRWSSYCPITRTLSTSRPPSSSCVASALVGIPIRLQLPFGYRAGQLGTKPDVLTHREDVYPQGENAFVLGNLHNFQSMFKAGQLLRVIILNLASLLISICCGFRPTRLCSPISHTCKSAQTQSTGALAVHPPTYVTLTRWRLPSLQGILYMPNNQDTRLDILSPSMTTNLLAIQVSPK